MIYLPYTGRGTEGLTEKSWRNSLMQERVEEGNTTEELAAVSPGYKLFFKAKSIGRTSCIRQQLAQERDLGNVV